MIALIFFLILSFAVSKELFLEDPLKEFSEFKLFLKEEREYKRIFRIFKVKRDCRYEVGYASWYGPKFHYRKTANGERFNMFKLTAASRTFSLGTYVLVYNLENGKFTVVRINDRGPYVDGRIIDLSMAAADEIGMLKKGVAKVLVIPLKCLAPSTQVKIYEEVVKDIMKTY